MGKMVQYGLALCMFYWFNCSVENIENRFVKGSGYVTELVVCASFGVDQT
jgi:hypothetical protein